MKVALIDPSLFTWPYDIALTRGLVANGHEVTVYARKPPAPLPASEAPYLDPHFYKSLNGAWAKRIPAKLFLALKGFSHIASMLSLAARLRKQRPDIIHFQWTPLAIVDKRMLALFRTIAPIVFTVHDSAPFNDNPKSKLQRIGATAIMARFDGVIVHTEKAEQRVRGYGVPPDRIRRIAHGLLDQVFPSGAAPAGKPADAPVELLLFGQIKPYKGTEQLIRAIARLPADIRSRCRLRIVGRPQMPMEPILDLVETLGLGDRVLFDLRFVEDKEIGDILHAADIQMFPYTEIDASGVLMLALSVGKPIIASDIGYFRELLEHGVHGALVPPNDVEALGSAIHRLIDDAALRHAMAANVVKLCEDIPDWAAIGRSTGELYQHVIARRRPLPGSAG